MKKTLILSALLSLPILASAQSLPTHVTYEKGLYAVKISPDGKWVGSVAGSASLFNTETGKQEIYTDCLLGLGNTVTNDGVAVGNLGDGPAVLKNGQTIIPKGAEDYWFCPLNAITPDGKKVVGIVNNPNRDGVSDVPMIADLDGDGNLSNITILPYPKTDFFRATPQFVTAVWISDDAKTVIGQVLDWRGFYCYPIVFKQDASGKWDYNLPSEKLFNPTHINIPDNPWLDEPEMPVGENYITNPLKKRAYQLAYEQYQEGLRDMPMPEEYMTDEDYERYKKAVESYNEWYYGVEDRINEYLDIYYEVLGTSPAFELNEMALHPSGEYLMTHGGLVDEKGDVAGKIYRFDCDGSDYEVISGPNPSLYPSQILSDGTLIAALPMMEVPTSYIKLPGSKTFITIEEYLKPQYPEISKWIADVFPGGTGLVCVNEDISVLAGGLIPAQLSDYNEDTDDFYYSTYIVNLLSSGIEEIMATPEDGVYTVFNMHGVKVLQTKDASQVNALPSGLYIINGRKVLVR